MKKNSAKKSGLFQIVQLWVNLPPKDKKTNPKYQEVTNSMMGRHFLADEKSFIEVITGEYKGVKGPASTFTPMQVYNAKLKKGATATLSFPSNYNTGLLVIEGFATINGTAVATDHFVLLKNEGDEIDIEATEDTIILVLSGEPIDEPIAAYGPFLMNSWKEVEEAIESVSRGKFGVLED